MPKDNLLIDELEAEEEIPMAKGKKKTAKAAAPRTTEARTVPHAELLAHLQDGEPLLDPVLDAPAPEPPPAPAAVAPEPDALTPVEGMVPIYNATAYAFEILSRGDFFCVRAGGVDLVPEHAADLACGVDNTGGKHSRFGLRRLYAAEERLRGHDVSAMNAAAREAADADWRTNGVNVSPHGVAAGPVTPRE